MAQQHSVHDPIANLSQSLGKEILIRCKRQKTFKGILRSYDAHLNVLLEEVTYTHSIWKDEDEDKDTEVVPSPGHQGGVRETQIDQFPKIVLRGDSIVFIGLAP